MAEEEPVDKKAADSDEKKADAKGDEKKDVKEDAKVDDKKEDKPKDNKDKLSYVIDAMHKGPCEERLNMTTLQLEEDLEYFSRKFNLEDWEHASKIHANLTA